MASTLKVQNIAHTDGTTGLTVDSAGRVTKPAIPCWNVSADNNNTSNTTTGAWTDLNRFQTAKACDFLNGGCTFTSNTYITVPVTGFYQVNATIRADVVTSGYLWMFLSKNNSENPATSGPADIWNNPNPNYHTHTMTGLMSLSAGDTVRIKYYSSADNDWHVSNASFFSGFLAG